MSIKNSGGHFVNLSMLNVQYYKVCTLEIHSIAGLLQYVHVSTVSGCINIKEYYCKQVN